MEKKKYDTNPLDPDYARKTDEIWGATRSAAHADEVRGATRETGRETEEQANRTFEGEAPTRRYDTPLSSSYPSVHIPPLYQPPPAHYQPPAPPAMKQTLTSRTVAGIGLPENATVILPYVPFYVGAVAAVIELFVVPRHEVRTRFHAAQGLALHLAILLISVLFSIVGEISGSSLGGTIFSLAAFIFLLISIIRVWRGEPHHIAPLTELTRWLNERIAPKK